MDKSIIYGNLWIAELDDSSKLVFSEAGECVAEREFGDIIGDKELKSYLNEQDLRVKDVSHISEYSAGDGELDFRLCNLNPYFQKGLFSKPGMLITSECSKLLAGVREGTNLSANVLSIKYRDRRDRMTNPFHYSGIIAVDERDMCGFLEESGNFFGVYGEEISDLLTLDLPISSGIYITPNVIKRYNKD